MTDQTSSDSRGHGLLAQRILEAEESLLRMDPVQLTGRDVAAARWQVGGLGSSEAHARYLAGILNQFSEHSAAFVPMTQAFLHEEKHGTGWMYFSQGFSHNAVAATQSWLSAPEFPRILVTAADPDQLEASGQSERAAHLRALVDSGVTIVPMPGRDEYTILIRVIGPLCGFRTALSLARSLGAACLTDFDNADLVGIRQSVQETWTRWGSQLPEEWIVGAALNLVGPLSECRQNLALKRLEGIYRDPSPCRDLMTYAHGFFQRETLVRRPQWILCSEAFSGHGIVEGFKEMNRPAGIPVREVISPVAFPLDVFFYEMLWNRLLLEGVKELNIDQIGWPGKGGDGPLYQWNKSL